MARSDAATVKEYLDSLPEDRRKAISRVRQVIRKHLPRGYREGMQFGMIGYTIPLSRYPDTYNRQPLAYAALASQKNYCSLYLMTAYASSDQEARLREAFRKAGKKLDMGKCCIRFKTADDLPLAAIGKAIAATPVKRYIEIYESTRR
ncbi:MAG: DUF1801 domain-containing protein [Gemmatimonadales bacterium]